MKSKQIIQITSPEDQFDKLALKMYVISNIQWEIRYILVEVHTNYRKNLNWRFYYNKKLVCFRIFQINKQITFATNSMFSYSW